jgi:hypothetical protein
MHQRLITQLGQKLERLIGDLFFPPRGSLMIDPSRREFDQRTLLQRFAPSMNIDDFIAGSPVLQIERMLWTRAGGN